jgi:hypothetical protein
VQPRVEAIGQPFYSPPDRPMFRRTWSPSKGLELKWPDPVVTTANANLFVRQTRVGRHLVAQAPSGTALWEQPLPAEAVRWGVAVDARGRIIAAVRDGRVLCFGSSAP